MTPHFGGVIVMRHHLQSRLAKKFASRISIPITAAGLKIKSGPEGIRKNIATMSELAYRFYAENRRALLLLVLQGMDTSGKDGTIRHVMEGFNPQSCQVTSFKQPEHRGAKPRFSLAHRPCRSAKGKHRYF